MHFLFIPTADKIPRLVQIIQERIPSLKDAPADELEIDIDSLDPATLRELDRYVSGAVKAKKKQPKPLALKKKPAPKPAAPTSSAPVPASSDSLAERMRRGGSPSASSSSSSR